MAFLDDLKKKANQTVQSYANSAEGQKRLSEYNASNAKKSTVSSVKNTVQKTFQPITDLASKAMPKMESNWYKGSKPTQRETLARIYEVGNQDPSKRDSLMQMYQAELNDPASPIYNPYTSATTTSLSKTNLNNTLKAQQEWEELTKELAWWAQHPSRNYSDDEIVARVNWKNYPTLAKMDDGREKGSPYALTEAVGYSKDAMYGVLWAARNPNKSTGDYMLDAVQSVLGRGKQYQPDEKTANRRNPKSKEYNPYAVGSTMDELAYKYGVYSFDQEWLDNNRHLIANPDTNADYGKIYNAVKNTEAINAEAKSFNNDVARLLEAGQPVDVDKIIERGEYSHLKKIQESLDSGQRIDTTAAIDFDPYLLQTDADAYLQQVTGDYTTNQYDQMLSDNMGGSYLPDESKQNSEELRKLNTDVNLPEYIPVATEHELRAFKTTANAGYSDVVYTTADLIANGTGGLAQANAAQQKAAHAYANKNLFDAWDALNDEVGFADAMPDDVAAFLQKYFPEKYEAGELPTMYDVATLDMSNHPGEDLNNVVATWNEMYEYAEAAMEDAAGRNEAAEKARQTVSDVMDDLAEVYGEGTDQYNAAVATYEMSYAYTRGVPKVWHAYDAYQDASAEGPITVEYGNSVLTNQRGSNARDIRVLNALIENAEIMGLPEQYVKNMRQQAEDLKTQNDLLNAHKLQENDDYDQQVAAFDAQYQPYKPTWFSRPSHAEVVMHAVYDPESAIALGAAEQSDTVMLAMSMTPEERDNYKYKFMTEGEESATAYFDALSENLYVRSAEERSERTQEWASANEWNSALATVGSVAMTPLEGFSALATVVSELQGKDINPYGPTFLFSQAKSDLRTGTKKGFEKAYGDNKVITDIYNTFYDALTSAADSGISTLMGGKYGSMILGLSGFNSAVMDASMRGASDERAFLYGIASACIEAATEKSQIDKMMGAFKNGSAGVRGFLSEVLTGFASEAGEEALSSVLGTIADDQIMQAMSNREAAIQEYIGLGLSPEEAEQQANRDILTGILYDGLVGGISGGLSTTAGYAAGKVLGDNEQPAQTEQPTGTPVQRAEAALSTAMQEGVGEVQQTATVAGVLQSFGLSDMEANAAAKNIVGSTNTRVLRKMLAQADDPAGLIQAIAMGSVSERSRSWEILHNARVDSKNAKDIGDQLIAAYNEDVNDQSVMTEYDARVAFDAEADATADIIANSGRVDTSALDKAKEQSTNAQLEMDKAESEVEAAQQAVVEAQDRFNANPSDDKAKLALKNAINLQYKARERSEAAKRNAILAKKHLDKANSDFKAQTEANMVAAREQAMQNVGQQVQEIQAKRVDTATEKADAMYGYSDEARADILAEKRLTVSEMPEPDRQVTAKDIATLEQSKKRDAVKYISGLLEKFGIFKKYNNQNAYIEFEFTKSGLNESANKQADRGGDYISFAKMLVNLDSLVANAVPVETHTDKYVGTRREDQQLERVYVLLSAFRDGDSVVPVQFEVKEFRDKENKLYVAVSLKKTEAADLHAVPSADEASATTASSFEEAGRGADTSTDAKSTTASSEISIPELIKKINPEDGDFLKYIPDSMLSDEQIQSKMNALEKERVKIEKLRNENNPVVTNAGKRSEIQRTQVPSQTVQGNQNNPKIGVSQFAAKTGQNTSVLSNDAKNQLRKSPFYQKTSERQNMDIAINNIEIEGYETRRNKLLDGSINLFTPEGQVEAFVLAKAAKEAGDAQGESAIAFKVKESGTLLGQSLAMRRMYLEMTPEGKTQFLQRTVDKINQDYANRGKATRVVLPEWVEARLKEADGDEEAIAKIVDKAYTAIAEQMPPDWKSRLNAWRYTAMLANPRTHTRNIAGNLMFMPAVSIKNKIGAVAEMVFASPDERTKTFAPVRQEYKDFAVAQLEDVKDALTGGGKHNPMSEIQSRRRDFNTKALEWLSKGNGKLLEKEDAFFLNKHFVNALSGFLQARNVDVNNVDANTLQAGLDYAVLEAQKATYRDASEIADKLSKFTSGLSNSKKRSARAAGLLVEGALPFKKTPINVMRRGIEYSPVGLLNTLTTGLYDMKKGNIEKTEFLDRLASGLTGTGLAAVGAMLYSVGHLKLSLDDPEDELEKLSGAQEYSIELFGKSFTIDWLSPSAMPLFVGGAIAELFEKDGEGVNLNTVTDALMSIAEPVFNLSMLDGVNSLLSAASNSENGVADIAIRAAESYATQFVPTVLGAFARTFDPVRRTTYTDKNSGMPNALQYLRDSVVNKIPGASYSGQPYLNAWGEEDTTESFFMRAVENFLSPGYINDLTTDDVEKGLMELYDETKEPGLVPKLPQKYFTVNKQRKDLTGEEYEQLVKERGKTAKSLHEQLFGNPDFLNLPAKYQVYALEQVWEYATQTAKQGVAPEYEIDSWVAAAKNPADAVLEKTQDKAKKDRSTEMKNNLYSAIDSGDLMNAATYVEGIMQGGTEKGSLRTSITNQYKSKYQQMYADGDIEGMRQLENTLLALNVGYKLGTIQKWIVDNEE